MLIAVDIGNTNTVVGAFNVDTLAGSWRLASDPLRTADEYRFVLATLLNDGGIAPGDVRGACIASVVPQLVAVWQGLCRRFFNVEAFVVVPGSKFGIAVRYKNPHELGADRVLAAAAAYHRFRRSLIVIDFGTATTIDYVAPDGAFVGGSIVPGMTTAGDALIQKAKKLPGIDYRLPQTMIGGNTHECLQIGILGSYIAMLEGMIGRIKQEVQTQPLVVATGGVADLITQHTAAIDEVDEHLQLLGLKLVYELNC